ncbi:MAG: hypothetical protein C4342_04085 [Armatimonadota bacterium]
MNPNDFIDELGDAYYCVGRPVLEGKVIALLLLASEPQSLGELAAQLGVSKAALLKVVRPMVERGDLKRWREPSSRAHRLGLTDQAYIHDLRVHVLNSRRVLEATRKMLRKKGLKEGVRAQLARHAEVVRKAVQSLEAVVRSVEEEQSRDLEEHLERDWDALPPRKGRGRNPKLKLT